MNAGNLTADQLHTLRHMLGINTPEKRVPKPYRNYYAANPGDAKLRELELLGAVKCYRRAITEGEYDYFRCTDAGRLAAMQSFRAIRHSKSSRVYSTYLSISDYFPDLTFKEFLTDPQWTETRRNA